MQKVNQKGKFGHGSSNKLNVFPIFSDDYVHGVSYVFGRFYEAVLRSLSDLK